MNGDNGRPGWNNHPHPDDRTDRLTRSPEDQRPHRGSADAGFQNSAQMLRGNDGRPSHGADNPYASSWNGDRLDERGRYGRPRVPTMGDYHQDDRDQIAGGDQGLGYRYGHRESHLDWGASPVRHADGISPWRGGDSPGSGQGDYRGGVGHRDDRAFAQPISDFDSYGSHRWSGGHAQPGGNEFGSSGVQRAAGRGRFPKNYTRSDERIKDDVCECLYRHDIDASTISVEATDGTVTLEGTVLDRRAKHRIEDLVEQCMGVKDIDNRIRVQREGAERVRRTDNDIQNTDRMMAAGGVGGDVGQGESSPTSIRDPR